MDRGGLGSAPASASPSIDTQGRRGGGSEDCAALLPAPSAQDVHGRKRGALRACGVGPACGQAGGSARGRQQPGLAVSRDDSETQETGGGRRRLKGMARACPAFCRVDVSNQRHRRKRTHRRLSDSRVGGARTPRGQPGPSQEVPPHSTRRPAEQFTIDRMAEERSERLASCMVELRPDMADSGPVEHRFRRVLNTLPMSTRGGWQAAVRRSSSHPRRGRFRPN